VVSVEKRHYELALCVFHNDCFLEFKYDDLAFFSLRSLLLVYICTDALVNFIAGNFYLGGCMVLEV